MIAPRSFMPHDDLRRTAVRPTPRAASLLRRTVFLLAALAVSLVPALALGQAPPLKIAILSTLQGVQEPHGRTFLESAQLAVEEANRARPGRRLVIETYDDKGTDEGAREAAQKIAASDAQLVVGPLLSTSALAAGPILAKAGIATIVSTAESDLVTESPTTFQAVNRNSHVGEWLAAYFRHALGGSKAAIVFVDNGYGRTFTDGFGRGAAWLGVDVVSFPYTTDAERQEALRRVAAEPGHPAVVLVMLDADSAASVIALRRMGVMGPLMGGTGMVEDSFLDLLKGQPEERRERNFFTRNVYGVVPVMLDSANAQTLAFAERLRTHVGPGKPPASWTSVQGYDAGRLAAAAVLQSEAGGAGASLAERRQQVRRYLSSLDSPARSAPGLLGPIWFTPERSRPMPVRFGRFNEGRFESAPLQLVPVASPSEEEIASGALVAVGPGQYARRQQVVHTGVFLNEIGRMDIAQSSFSADFYVWVRFAQGVATADADPTQIAFPDMVRGSFDARQAAVQRNLPDGTAYRLWRVNGEFKNDFDLHRYPADRQTLDIRFFNARADSNRVIYVLDRGTIDPRVGDGLGPGGGAMAEAFRNLTQWEPRRVAQRRENLVTQSGLGDPVRIGQSRVRELSGFNFSIEIHRLIGTTLIKTLLPVGLMTLIMFATLWFPSNLAAAKVTVAITAGLSGAVLLSSINAQLGNVGYVIAVEYGFYVFFGLCLLCILTVVLAERMRLAGLPERATTVERCGRYTFLTGLLTTVVAAIVALEQWR
jgi:branched-chain amino acid transport system substrate-binding protein